MNPLAAYITGFAVSVALTAMAFWSVESARTAEFAALLLVLLAVGQLVVQAICFLHLSDEDAPRWRLFSLVLTLAIVAIVVGGTVWVMENVRHGGHTREVFEGGLLTPQAQRD